MKPFKKLLPAFFLICAVTVNAQTSPSDTSKRFENIVFNKVEVEAGYTGGDEAWINFLRKNLNAGVAVDNDAPGGKYTVIVKFIVSRDGSLSDIQAETNLGFGMEQEVIRIIKKSGTWTPAMQNNRPVNAYRRQPVTFLVEDDEFEIATKVPFTLFTGTDNRITIDVKKVKPEDITATISQGSITALGDGIFIVKVKETGRATITIYGKKNKKIGASSFEVINRN